MGDLPIRLTIAAAYHIVAPYLSDKFFTSPPPPGSVDLVVTALCDRRQTRWTVHRTVAAILATRLEADDRIATVDIRPGTPLGVR